MTIKQIFEYALVELNKKDAPSLLLEDYNYYINKSINQYINKVYNMYDVDQQRSDDLRVLKSTSIITPTVNDDYATSDLFSKVYEANLPDDYLHILGCTVEYAVKKAYKCYNAGDYFQIGAKRLTADIYPQLINNYYARPSYRNPYFYINNVSTTNTYPTEDNITEVIAHAFTIDVTYGNVDTSVNISTSSKIVVIELDGKITTISVTSEDIAAQNPATSLASKLTTAGITNSVSGDTISISGMSDITVYGPGLYLSKTPSNTAKIANTRYGNNSKVRIEIRYGKDASVFELSKIYVDYLKSPKFVRLTQDQVDAVEDTSQELEYPDYVCQEILNDLIKLLMENSSDPRLQTHIPVNTSIATPQQQQPQQPQQRK
jgi:hypothetical protein